MQKIVIAVTVTIFLGCIFVPEEPPLPAGKFEDRLNFREIVSETSAYFSFNSYLELFENSVSFYCDANDQEYSSNDFLGRINSICADTSIRCFWSGNDAGDVYISMNEAVELNIRNFKIVSKNISDTIRGEARITIRYGGLSGWQIVRWREIGEKYSYFHPYYSGFVGN
ncbi:MAG: hypothetical protein LBH98_01945 [Chitinispirillales bacterium]|nr:hypothetical protein [Chitinispirillales bacterium]